MNIKIDIKGFDQLSKRWSKLSSSIKQETNNTFMKAGFLIEADAKRNVSTDSGRLRSSIRTQKIDKGVKVSPTTKYAVFVEKGTRPHFPPIKAIEKWARRKGLSPFVVAKAISQKGTKKRPFLIPAYEKNKEKIKVMFDKLISQIIKKV